MANENLNVTISGDTAKYERALDRARVATADYDDKLTSLTSTLHGVEGDLKRLEDRAQAQKAAAWEKAGKAMVAFGAATAVGLGMAVREAMQWETAWTGVLKTVDGSPEQLAALEEGLRDLATTLPASHQEIAAVAEAAGQLGVGVEDVETFTRTMINLGETTNMSAEEAATALARMANIMGTSLQDVDRMGATIVELGNNSATTEAEITTLATRLAAAGTQAGLSEADVFAFASTLTSVGVKAEAGGTALSKAFTAIGDAVRDGNEDLSVFAEVAGVTTDQFVTAFEDDAAGAITMFIEGLDRMQRSGESTSAVFDELGLADQRLMRALLSTASAGDLLSDQIEMANQGWEDNTALVEEAEKRYDTAEAKIAIAKNTLVDLAIDVGEVLLPAMVGLLETGTDIVQWFADLPGPVQSAATILGALAGAASLAGGAFLLLGPKIAAARQNIAVLARTAPVATGAVLTLGSAMAKLGTAAAAGFIGVEVLKQLGFEAANSFPAIDSATGSIALRFASLNKGSREMASGVGEATEALLNLGEGMQVSGEDGAIEDSLINIMRNTNELGHVSESAAENLKVFDTALAEMASSGSGEKAEESLAGIQENLGLTDVEMDNLVQMSFPAYRDALAQNRLAERETTEEMENVDSHLMDLATRFQLTGEDAEEAAQEMLDAWADAASEFVDALGAYDDALSAKEEAEQEAAQATADSTEDAEDSWEDYIGNVELTVDEYLAQLERMVENQEEWRGNLVSLAGRASDEMLQYLVELGPEGADLVALYAQMTDDELKDAESMWRQSTASGTAGIVDELVAAGPDLEAVAASHGEEVANKIRDHMIENGGSVRDAAHALGIEIEGALPSDVEVPVSPTQGWDGTFIGGLMSRLQSDLGVIRVPVQPTPGQPGYGVMAPGQATGGPVLGPGSETSDSILRRLSHNEHVWTAAEVRAAGGHAAVEQMRTAVMNGTIGTFSAAGSSSSGGGGRQFDAAGRSLARWAQVTEEDWQALLRAGWRGRAGDEMEALYPPLELARDEFVRLGEVTETEWQTLLALGWRGRAGDKMEALYPPMDDARDAFVRLAEDVGGLTGGGGESPLQKAANQMLDAIRSGAMIAEDFSFHGMPKSLRDDDGIRGKLLDLFYSDGRDFKGRGPGMNRIIEDFLESLVGGRSSAASRSAMSTPLAASMSSPVSSLIRMDRASAPDEFTATATLDLGEGIQQVVDIQLKRHDRGLKRRAKQGTGAAR